MAVNDEIFKNLAQYGGGTINERVYNFLGSLGYTGTINDRLGQFEEGGRKGWQGLIRAWGQYTPAQLFSQGQEGVWYEPKPIVAGQQVLYQDSAGTTPVAADGDPVGLGLDRHKGLALGPEEIANGGFDEGEAGWTLGSLWSVSGGAASMTETADYNPLYQTINVEQGKSYEVSFDILAISGTSDVVLRNGTSFATTTGVRVSEVGSYKEYLHASSDGDRLTVSRASPSTSTSLSIDNISVRELPGNHLTQATSADRPTYGTDEVIHWLGFDGVSDNLQTAFDQGIFLDKGFILSVAARFISTSDGTYLTSLSNGSDATDWLSIRTRAGIFEFRCSDGAGSNQDIAGFSTDTVSHVFTVIGGADSLEFYIDGQKQGEKESVTPLTVQDVGLGLLLRSTIGPYGEVEIYGHVFSTGPHDRAQVENYLANLAGITL